MSMTDFNNVSVVIPANISYDGRCSSHTILFADGSKKMVGIFLPNDGEVKEYQFETHTSERMEITTGECEVKIKGEKKYNLYRAGDVFLVAGNSSFTLKTKGIVQYICHLEG